VVYSFVLVVSVSIIILIASSFQPQRSRSLFSAEERLISTMPSVGSASIGHSNTESCAHVDLCAAMIVNNMLTSSHDGISEGTSIWPYYYDQVNLIGHSFDRSPSVANR
jgi:hypothetical protein